MVIGNDGKKINGRERKIEMMKSIEVNDEGEIWRGEKRKENEKIKKMKENEIVKIMEMVKKRRNIKIGGKKIGKWEIEKRMRRRKKNRIKNEGKIGKSKRRGRKRMILLKKELNINKIEEIWLRNFSNNRINRVRG